MKREVLILTSQDPRLSRRTAEAVRVAAGLSAHGRLSVTLCLRGKAAGLLSGIVDELLDGEGAKEHLAVLTSSGAKIVVVSEGDEASMVPEVQGVESIGPDAMGMLFKQGTMVLRF